MNAEPDPALEQNSAAAGTFFGKVLAILPPGWSIVLSVTVPRGDGSTLVSRHACSSSDDPAEALQELENTRRAILEGLEAGAVSTIEVERSAPPSPSPN